ncbi:MULTISPECIES: RNA-binding domain-containing protein [unclassified Clostridium]|uniref:RNA-binding domain-containing protein n=1 Tax=unclassified Clostridium TaxID=2614128 RepID=UPI001106234E|nr:MULTISPECIES: RNA-binding domain-containing protein [unclassified Clostridium]
MSNIGIKENLIVEFKSDLAYLPDNDIIDAVVAFANTDGGDLYLGVEDSGEITGLHKDHMDTTRLSAFIANKTVPPVSVRTEVLDLDRPVLKISVPKRTSIIASSSGKILRRRIKADGLPENVPMYPYEIASRLSSLSLLDYSAQPVPDSDYSDLDPIERERLRNIIRSYRGETPLLELDDIGLDKALQFVTMQDGKLVPTFCGLLIIGKADSLKHHMPTAEASIQILEGTDIRVNESFFLPILAAFDKIVDRFSAWNGSEEIEMGLFRITIPDYDLRAFREALVNAFCHRDYSVLGRVRIQINDEGMTITNPGGFIEGITVNNLLDAEPHGRNVVLANALKRIGLAERTGRGIDRIYEGSLLNGRLLPDYSKSTATRVELFIPKGPTDKAFIQMVSTEQKRLGRSLPIYSLLVLNALKNLSRASIRDVAEYLNIDESRARVSLETLADSGIIEAGGNGRGRYYMLGVDYYRNIDNPNEYIRRKDIDSIRHNELVLELAKQQKTVSRKDVVDLLHITPPQAYRLLQKLVLDDKLSLVGRGAGAKYVLK